MPAPTTAFAAGVQSIAVAALLFLFGFLVAGALTKRLDLSITARLALAVPGLLASVCIVMVVHIVTGGGILSRPGLVRGATAVGAITLLAVGSRKRLRHLGSWRDPDAILALGVVVVAVAIWCLPVFTNLPLSFHGDVKRHMAWAAQLTGGHSTPTGVITGNIPNYYPWLFHALTSFVAAFTPGGRVMYALGPLQVLAVVGSVLGFLALARELFGARIAAGSGALLGALSGGFGFLLTRSPTLVVDPRVEADVARFGGDFMFLRSYNLAFHNLAPPFHRDFGFMLLVSMMLLLAIGLRRRDTVCFVAAGCVLGLIGLMTGESFIVGALFVLGLIAWGPGISRARAVLTLFGCSMALYALWLVPMAVNYARLGVADTSGEPVILTPLSILFGWGIAVPLALVGVFAWRGWPDPGRRVVLSFAAAAGIAVATAGIAPWFDEGFTTLGRHHRYWPLVYIAVALAGAYGAQVTWHRLQAIRRGLAVPIALIVAGAAVASPLLASIAVTRRPLENADLPTAMRGDDTNILNVLGEPLDRACEVAVPKELSRSVPAYTGARLVYFVSGTSNQAGIRWSTLPDEVEDETRSVDNRMLVTASVEEEQWRSIIRRYGVDRVVIPATEPPPVAAGYPTATATGEQGGPYVVVETGDC